MRLSTPLLLTWGASDFENNGKFDMALQFPSDEYKNADTDAFLKNLVAFEEKIKADALVYSKEWFGKQHKSAEVVDALWSPMLKYSRNKVTGEADITKAPSLRVKIPYWEGVWKVEIYDEDDNKLFPNVQNPSVTPLDFLQKGVNVACLLHCGGLWFANGKFGITWKLVQALGQKPRASLSGQCFIKLKKIDKEKLKAAPAPDAFQDTQEHVIGSTLVEDSDDEQEEEEDQDNEDSEHVAVASPVVTAPPVAVAPPVVTASSVATASEPAPSKKKVVKKKVVE